jgi:hypothetical protein
VCMERTATSRSCATRAMHVTAPRRRHGDDLAHPAESGVLRTWSLSRITWIW